MLSVSSGIYNLFVKLNSLPHDFTTPWFFHPFTSFILLFIFSHPCAPHKRQFNYSAKEQSEREWAAFLILILLFLACCQVDLREWKKRFNPLVVFFSHTFRVDLASVLQEFKVFIFMLVFSVLQKPSRENNNSNRVSSIIHLARLHEAMA